MDTYLKDLMVYLQNEISQGKTEFRVVAHENNKGHVTAYMHPLNKNGETFDFELSEIGDGVVMTNNPLVPKAK
jgi:hypothetical protein